MQSRQLTLRLALLGALPFAAFSVLLALGVRQIPWLGNVSELLSSYSLVIAVFMCGIHWGQYLQQNDQQFVNLFLVSNILTVLLWFAYLLVPVRLFLIFALIVFIAILLIDTRLLARSLITASYFKTRLIVTSVVGVFLLLAIYAI